MRKSWSAVVPVTIVASVLLVTMAPTAARAQGQKSAPIGAEEKKAPADSSVVPVSVVPLPTEAPPPVDIFSPSSSSGVDTVNRVVAVVGKTAITWSELLSTVYQQVAAGMPMPRSVEGQYKLGNEILEDLVNQELLVQKAPDLKIEVTDEDAMSMADQRIKQTRAHFASDAEYRSELQKAGLGTPDDYRKFLMEQARRTMLQRKVIGELSKTAKPGSVTDAEVDTAYARVKDELAKRPAMATFRQIVIAPKPSPQEDSVAKAKALAILAKLRAGDDFAETAKRESMDPSTKNLGGDLGWARRGGMFVPEFEYALFSLRPGQISEPVKTTFGYHIIKVDRVQPAEVKGRHILIIPNMDSTDVSRARVLADSVAKAWRAGASFDQLVAKFHDPNEEKAVLQPWDLDSLPASYKPVVAALQPNEISAPFTLQAQTGDVKFCIIQVLTKTGTGEYSLSEVRETLRRQLAQEKQIGAILEKLKQQTYVSVRFGPST